MYKALCKLTCFKIIKLRFHLNMAQNGYSPSSKAIQLLKWIHAHYYMNHIKNPITLALLYF